MSLQSSRLLDCCCYSPSCCSEASRPIGLWRARTKSDDSHAGDDHGSGARRRRLPRPRRRRPRRTTAARRVDIDAERSAEVGVRHDQGLRVHARDRHDQGRRHRHLDEQRPFDAHRHR